MCSDFCFHTFKKSCPIFLVYSLQTNEPEALDNVCMEHVWDEMNTMCARVFFYYFFNENKFMEAETSSESEF